MLPPTSTELSVTHGMQVAAILGVGLVFQASGHRHTAETLLAEIGKSLVKPFTTQSRLLTILYQKFFENLVGKGENAGKQHFLLFSQCFQLFPKQSSMFRSH